MGDEMFRQFSDRGVGHHGNFSDLFMMIPNKAEMLERCAEALPVGELCKLQDQSGEFSCFFQKRVNFGCQPGKIRFAQWAGGMDKQDRFCFVELLVNHIIPSR